MTKTPKESVLPHRIYFFFFRQYCYYIIYFFQNINRISYDDKGFSLYFLLQFFQTYRYIIIIFYTMHYFNYFRIELNTAMYVFSYFFVILVQWQEKFN